MQTPAKVWGTPTRREGSGRCVAQAATPGKRSAAPYNGAAAFPALGTSRTSAVARAVTRRSGGSMTSARRCHRDGDATPSSVVECDIQQLGFVMKASSIIITVLVLLVWALLMASTSVAASCSRR